MKKFFILVVVFFTVILTSTVSANTLPKFPHHQEIMEKVFKLRVENFFQKRMPKFFEEKNFSFIRLKETSQIFLLQLGVDVSGKTQVIAQEDTYKLAFSGHIDDPQSFRKKGRLAIENFLGGLGENEIQKASKKALSLEESGWVSRVLNLYKN